MTTEAFEGDEFYENLKKMISHKSRNDKLEVLYSLVANQMQITTIETEHRKAALDAIGAAVAAHRKKFLMTKTKLEEMVEELYNEKKGMTALDEGMI